MDSFIKWMGGKSRMRGEIIDLIPPHKSYCEVFGGAGWVLFGKPPSPAEFLNDIDGELVNLFLVVRDRLSSFIECFERLPVSEALFNSWCIDDKDGIPVLDLDLQKQDEDALGIPGSALDIERAVMTYYIVMNSFNGKIGGKPVFAVYPGKEAGVSKFYSTDWEAVRDRLKRVTLLSRDFGRVIKTVDNRDTFFYLDPPYLCATDNARYYRYTFNRSDHEKLLVYLGELEGKFLLSYGDDPLIWGMYKDFNIRRSEVQKGELLISNYDMSDDPFYLQTGYTNTSRASTGGIPSLAVYPFGIPGRARPRVPDGIPARDLIRRAPWSVPNCPGCGSRKVQSWYKRLSLGDGKRSFKSKDKFGSAFGCEVCGVLFRGGGGV